MFRFFPHKSKQYASYMELHITATTDNIFGILHLKTVVKSMRFIIFWYKYFMVTTLRSKFTGVKALKCQIKLKGFDCISFLL